MSDIEHDATVRISIPFDNKRGKIKGGASYWFAISFTSHSGYMDINIFGGPAFNGKLIDTSPLLGILRRWKTVTNSIRRGSIMRKLFTSQNAYIC